MELSKLSTMIIDEGKSFGSERKFGLPMCGFLFLCGTYCLKEKAAGGTLLTDAEGIDEEELKQTLAAAETLNKKAFDIMAERIPSAGMGNAVTDGISFTKLLNGKSAVDSGYLTAPAILKELLEKPAKIYFSAVIPNANDGRKLFDALSAPSAAPSAADISGFKIPQIRFSGADKSADNGDKESAAESAAASPAESAKASAPSTSSASPAAPTAPVSEERAGIVDLVRSANALKAKLKENVFGQDRAVDTLVNGYFQACLARATGATDKKPFGVILFAGPPGVGKTFLAEQTAEALALPYMRFDMSEYCNSDGSIEFCGSDSVFARSKPGNVTGFVAKNPRCILLFDEVEKAHISVIHLFLQLLDAGRLRDNNTDKEVSFREAFIIFTTNAGRALYDNPSVKDPGAAAAKSIIKAIGDDVNPETGGKLFPAALCSRFAGGNVVMFNRLVSETLMKITNTELNRHADKFNVRFGLSFDMDDEVATAILFGEGGRADARSVKGKASGFFSSEIYELFRLLPSDNEGDADKIRQIKCKIQLPDDAEVRSLFVKSDGYKVLVFADKDVGEIEHEDSVTLFRTSDIGEAKEYLDKNDVDVFLCDITCGARKDLDAVLDIDDIDSAGREMLGYAAVFSDMPVYLIETCKREITAEEETSFAKLGIAGKMTVKDNANAAEFLKSVCENGYRQRNITKLARANKVLRYKSSQKIAGEGEQACIELYDLELATAVDADDAKHVLSGASIPDVSFDDVIGCEDAKEELSYFVKYIKEPRKYAAKGARLPKGVLLYGPPGTGKTLLAKAMAGECGATFVRAEGNQFLNKYVGAGAESLHSIFLTARKYAPSILFIDEIDSIGRERGERDYHADVLTALLTEMDGFNTDPSKPVFVLAATNFNIDPSLGASLDPALLRRFDRRILIDLPEKADRLKYLNMLIERNPLIKVSDETRENLALRSAGMSLADIESWVGLALRNALKQEELIVDDAVLEEAFELYDNGEEKKWNEATLERVARHEAGHAAVCYYCGNKPSYVTIVARGNHGGYVQHGEEDKGIFTRREILDLIRISLAGRAAERVYYGDEEGLSTGASSDLANATQKARKLLCDFGMDPEFGLGVADFFDESGALGTEIRTRVNKILADEESKAEKCIRDNLAKVDELVEALMDKGHLKGNEIEEILRADGANKK